MRARLLLLAFAINACSKDDPPQPSEAPTVERPSDPASAGEQLRLASVATIRSHIETLADDTFQGRQPGTEGGRQATLYVAAQMKHLGLVGADTDGDFRQTVPMRGVTPDLRTASYGYGAQAMIPREQIVASTLRAAGQHALKAEVVFAGYGITAPEYEWDDYAGVDVTDKIVVVLVGDPPVDDGRFHGKAMTYYGRWSYKFERALQAGAAGCLVVHDTAAASYAWTVVENSWSGERFGLLQPDGTLPPALALQGWIHADAAEALAKVTGSKLADWYEEAKSAGFAARPLGTTLHAKLTTTERRIDADNVLGKITGTTRADEAVLITAHWDHLGLATTLRDGDGCFNGAVDNASGIAGMLATAAALQDRVRAGQPPERTVLFLATTGEEQGLLGSRYYAEHPSVPLDDIVAVANLDSMNVHGRTKTVVVVGAGQSTLEDTLAEVLQPQGRRTVPDDRPEAGGYYRSDHFSFAARGVPAIYFRGGSDMEDGGTAAGAEIAKDMAARYHTVDDEYDPTWSLEGTLQDVEALTELVMRVANAQSRPAWKPASEFAPPSDVRANAAGTGDAPPVP